MGKIPYMFNPERMALLQPGAVEDPPAIVFVQTDTMLAAMKLCDPDKFVAPERLHPVRDVARLQLNIDHNVPISMADGYVYKNDDGKLEVYLNNGRHRTAFAKVVGDEEVPVWVRRSYSETAVDAGLARFATDAEIKQMFEAAIDPNMPDRAAAMPGVMHNAKTNTWEIG